MRIVILFPLSSSVWNHCPVLGNGLGMGTKLTQFQFETNLETDSKSIAHSWVRCMKACRLRDKRDFQELSFFFVYRKVALLDILV